MAEPYIKTLQRERASLIACLQAVQRWLRAVEFANVTGRKATAYKEVVRTEKEMDEALKIVEPLLAEKEKGND